MELVDKNKEFKNFFFSYLQNLSINLFKPNLLLPSGHRKMNLIIFSDVG